MGTAPRLIDWLAVWMGGRIDCRGRLCALARLFVSEAHTMIQAVAIAPGVVCVSPHMPQTVSVVTETFGLPSGVLTDSGPRIMALRTYNWHQNHDFRYHTVHTGYVPSLGWVPRIQY